MSKHYPIADSVKMLNDLRHLTEALVRLLETAQLSKMSAEEIEKSVSVYCRAVSVVLSTLGNF